MTGETIPDEDDGPAAVALQGTQEGQEMRHLDGSGTEHQEPAEAEADW
jgi:hypothetical protein